MFIDCHLRLVTITGSPYNGKAHFSIVRSGKMETKGVQLRIPGDVDTKGILVDLPEEWYYKTSKVVYIGGLTMVSKRCNLYDLRGAP